MNIYRGTVPTFRLRVVMEELDRLEWTPIHIRECTTCTTWQNAQVVTHRRVVIATIFTQNKGVARLFWWKSIYGAQSMIKRPCMKVFAKPKTAFSAKSSDYAWWRSDWLTISHERRYMYTADIACTTGHNDKVLEVPVKTPNRYTMPHCRCKKCIKIYLVFD